MATVPARAVQRILVSRRRHEELLRYPEADEWGIVGERAGYSVTLAEVLRDFGDEAVRRAALPDAAPSGVAPQTLQLVSRRLHAAFSASQVVEDDEDAFVVRTAGGLIGLRVTAGAFDLVSGLSHREGTPWLRCSSNHLGLSENLLVWLVAGEPDLGSVTGTPISVRRGEDGGLRGEWEPASWAAMPDGGAVLPHDIEALRARSLTDLLTDWRVSGPETEERR